MPEEKQEQIVTIHVPPGKTADTRLDVYLTEKIANATRSKTQRGIKEGQVSVNGQVITKPAYVVQPGDYIECRLLKPPPIELRPEAIPLDVIFEDDYLLVVNKPPGMVVHPAYGHRSGTLVNALLHHVGAEMVAMEGENEEPEDEEVGLSTVNAAPRFEGDPVVRPGIVHRLDKDTSGLMVVAKDDVSHARLAEQFSSRTIKRKYLALVWGVPDPPSGRIETQLGRDPRDRKKMAVVPQAQGKHAITNYETVEVFHYFALVQFRLETGRTHQIRVHAEHLGHPIFGDPTYGGRTIRYGPATGSRRAFLHNLLETLPRQALHAFSLGFRHPKTREDLYFEQPMPEDMAYVVEHVRGA